MLGLLPVELWDYRLGDLGAAIISALDKARNNKDCLSLGLENASRRAPPGRDSLRRFNRSNCRLSRASGCLSIAVRSFSRRSPWRAVSQDSSMSNHRPFA